MQFPKSLAAAAVLVALAGCDEVQLRSKTPAETKVAVTDPDYVILRPVTENGTDSAVLEGQRVSFNAADRILDLRHLDPATAEVLTSSDGRHGISIETTPDGAELLRAWTSANIGRKLAVFAGGRLISTPVIQSPIDGMIMLEGDFPKEQAEEMAARLRRGGSAQ